MRKMFAVPFAAAAVIGLAGPALAAVTFDPATGTGFVGKGDVQYTFGWNNKQLQDNAKDVNIAYSATTEQDTTWTCDRDAGPQTQERVRTTTTTVTGVVDVVERDNKKQVTGFRLDGFQDGSRTSTFTTDGPAAGSCPTGWTAINLVVGDEVTTSGGLLVSVGTGTLIPLLEAPVTATA